MPTFTDNLDGTAGDLLSARSGWSRPIGSDPIAIAPGGSGITHANGTNAANTTWHVPSVQPTGNDQYVKAVLVFHSGTNSGAFPLCVRCNTGSALGSGYILRRQNDTLQLYRRSSSGTLTSLGSATPSVADLANPVTLRVSGTTLTVELLGATVIGPVTDGTIASGNVAFMSRGGSPIVFAIADNWESGDVGGGGPTPIAGTANGNLGKVTGSAAATLKIKALASGNIGSITGSTDAKVQIKGLASGDVGRITGASAAKLRLIATGIGSIGAITGGSASKLQIEGAGTGNIGSITGSAAARLKVRASAVGNISRITGSANGNGGAGLPVSGAGNGAIGLIVGSAQAHLTIQASGYGRIGWIIGDASARLIINASASGNLGAIAGSAQGRFGTRVAFRWLDFAAEAKSLDFTVEAKALTFFVDPDGARGVKTLPNKLPEEVWLITLNLQPWIISGNQAVSFEVEPVRGAITVQEAELATPATGSFMLSGGEKGMVVLRAIATMQDGQKLGQELRVIVR